MAAAASAVQQGARHDQARIDFQRMRNELL
jgi:hypothetical protein